MVKGITRQVILVKSPDPKLFEQAIFILKDEAMHQEGISADQIIHQARLAANGYLGSSVGKRQIGRFSDLIWCIVGAVAASVGWAVWLFF